MVGPIFIAKLALRGCTIADRIKYAETLSTGISEEVMKEPIPNVPIPEILIPTLRVK